MECIKCIEVHSSYEFPLVSYFFFSHLHSPILVSLSYLLVPSYLSTPLFSIRSTLNLFTLPYSLLPTPYSRPSSVLYIIMHVCPSFLCPHIHISTYPSYTLLFCPSYSSCCFYLIPLLPAYSLLPHLPPPTPSLLPASPQSVDTSARGLLTGIFLLFRRESVCMC